MPLAIMNKAHQANQMYPFAISLMESVRTYERSWEKVREFKKIVFSYKVEFLHLFLGITVDAC